MIVAGLTGSIAMGKSTVAAHLQSRGVPVLDADRIVHDLYEGEAAPLIEAVFPGTASDGAVNRLALAEHVLKGEAELKKLEAIVHPLVREAEWRFLSAEQSRGQDLAFLEIPLLFETGAHDLFDAIAVVSAPAEAQRERLLERPGMSVEKFETIIARQWPDRIKRGKADYVVDTGVGFADTFKQIDTILEDILKKPALAFQRWADLYKESR